MPSILNLKFKGNKSFVAFSNLNDTESLTKTWKVCTKVASYLEQGQRLENLSWRLWHLQNLMVDTDNAKSKREFKKLSKCMGDKLDKEKGRSIEELEAPDFKRNHSTEMIRQRAVEKERNREASQNATPGTIKRMQFTFSVDQPAQPSPGDPVRKPDTKPSAEFTRRAKAPHAVAAQAQAAAVRAQADEDAVMADAAPHGEDDATAAGTQGDVGVDFFSSSSSAASGSTSSYTPSLHFPGLFGNDFGPSALLYAAPTCTTRMNYGEGFNPSANNDQFSISRPTIELALDDLLFNDDSSSDDGAAWLRSLHEHAFDNANNNNNNNENGNHNDHSNNNDNNNNTSIEKDDDAASTTTNAASASAGQQQDVVMSQPAPAPAAPAVHHTRRASSSKSARAPAPAPAATNDRTSTSTSTAPAEEEDIDELSPAPSTARKTSIFKSLPSLALAHALPETIAPSRLSSIYGTRSSTPTGRPTLTLRTQAVSTRSSGPGATATSVNAAVLRGGGGGGSGAGAGGGAGLNSAPGGVKAECSNCGATHTPLWRRGLNDELNCNACGLYCKLHKRPRPKSMRNSHGGEGRAAAAQVVQRQEAPDVMVAAQCYNCHTTATPLWRKDDEGKTVCNACGLYYKLHGSARPISMKSDVIRKRSRHDARRSGVPEDTPSASPGVSRRPSPAPETSPTLAPDSTTQMTYEYNDDAEFRTSVSSSELMGALGNVSESLGGAGTGPVGSSGGAGSNSSGSGGGGSGGGNGGAGGAQPLFGAYQMSFPGPYNPEYLMQLYSLPGDALPFAGAGEGEGDVDLGMSPRGSKRRRMSTDSGDEPPESAVSFGSFSGGGGDAFSSAASSASGGGSASGGTHSKRASMEFPFSTYGGGGGSLSQGPALRGSGNTFWHPPMMPQSSGSDADGPLFHGPVSLPTGSASSTSTSASSGSGSHTGRSTPGSDRADGSPGGGGGMEEDSPMDYLHPPGMGLQDEDSLFSSFLHPPLAIAEEGKGGVGMDEGGGHGGMYVESYFH